MDEKKKKVSEMMNETLGSVNGAFQNLNEQARTLVQTLMSQGKLSKEDGKKFVADMGEKIKQHRSTVETMLINKVDTAVSRFNASTQGQLEELSKKISQLSKEVEKFSSWKPGKKKAGV